MNRVRRKPVVDMNDDINLTPHDLVRILLWAARHMDLLTDGQQARMTAGIADLMGADDVLHIPDFDSADPFWQLPLWELVREIAWSLGPVPVDDETENPASQIERKR
jgi:hypothetical protein